MAYDIDPNGYHRAKDNRRIAYFRDVHGMRLRKCTACNGSGRYDHNGSPKCGGCAGSGKERFAGPKAVHRAMAY